ncbi:hypothetical protein BsWGS_12502 [Bradybaena similaris]
MSGKLCRVFLMAATAYLCVTVFGLSVDDQQGDGQGTGSQPMEASLTYSPLINDRKEPFKFIDDGTKEKTKRLDENKGQVAMEQPTHLKNSDSKGEIFDSNYVNGNEDDDDHFDNPHYGDTASDTMSSNPVYSITDEDLHYSDQNPELLEDTDNDGIFNRSTEDHNKSFDSFAMEESYSKSHGDEFPCPPCNCSYTANRFVIATCTKKKLYAFPMNLPKNTIILNLSFNKFENLNISSLLAYPSLLNVSFESNGRLRSISRGYETNKNSTVKNLNLFQCNITNIENGSFSLLPQLTILNLSRNYLTNLTGSLFEGLGNLERLDLSVNRIRKIELGTFDNFPKLQILNLEENKHFGYSNKTFLPLLFKNLKQLGKLSLRKMSYQTDESYPNQALEQLVNLQELRIDGLHSSAEFAPGMKSLMNLTHLHIGGIKHGCRIENITETFFDNIPYLRSFVLEFCPHFEYVHPNAYSRLQNLQSLTIKRTDYYDIDTAFKDLSAFNNSKLTSVTLNSLRKPMYQCKYLGIEQAKYITNIDIEMLDLSHNRIAVIGRDFLENLPKTLKTLILRRNLFTVGTHSLKHMAMLRELIKLDLSLQNTDTFFNRDDDDEVDLQTSEYSRTHVTKSNTDYTCSDMGIQEMKQNRCSGLDENLQPRCARTGNDIQLIEKIKGTPEVNRKELPIPPKMKILNAASYNMFGMQILTNKLEKNNSLSEIDFSKSFMSNWGSGVLPPNITHANLADNQCTKISKKFFRANNSHTKLLLNNNFLGPDFATDDNGAIFANLNNTVHLDISTNLIYKLSRNFFKGLSSLRYLNMSDNKLSYLNTSFSHMKSLQFIDLSRNSIRWISQETRNDLDAIATLSGHKIELDLTMNPLPCTCAGLDIITWMATTKVHFTNKNLLKCDTDAMDSELVVDLKKRRETLQRLCMSKTALIIGCVAALAVVMIAVGLGLMYRYRWKLRYLHNITIAAIFGFKPDVLPNSGCTFDAYFVYTKETQDFVINTCIKELELKRGHRLCVEDRDFLAGTYTVSNIVSAVRNSTKTVPVMTPTFYDGEFSEYSFKMAVMEELYNNRSVLHLLLYQPIPDELMTHDELKVMKRNSYIEYPPEEEVEDDIRHKFWDDLSLAIGHTKNPMPQELPDLQQRM